VIPAALRRPVVAGGVVGTGVLAPALSVGAWLHGCSPPASSWRQRCWPPGARPVRVGLGVAGVVAVCGTVGLVVEHGHADQRCQQVWAQASLLNRAQLLPSSPGRAAGEVVRAVAAGDPAVCTAVFTPAAGAQLAAAAGAHDCAAGFSVGRPASRPGSLRDTRPRSGRPCPGTVGRARSTWVTCGGAALRVWNGAGTFAGWSGPQVGHLELTRVLGQGYMKAIAHRRRAVL
jgi:hypothetical protein